jgi:hypothetical protein
MDIAKAVADELNFAVDSNALGQFATFNWSLIPQFEIANLAGIVGEVVPLSVEETNLTRQGVAREFEISVGIRKKIAEINGQPSAQALLDMGTFVDGVLSYMRRRTLTGLAGVKWNGSGLDPVYVPEQLREQGVYMALVRLRYAVHES